MMLSRFGFRFAPVLSRILPLRGYDRWSPLRYPPQDRFRLHFCWLFACACSHSCPCCGSNSGTNGCPLATARDGTDQGTQCGTATDLGHICLGVRLTFDDDGLYPHWLG